MTENTVRLPKLPMDRGLPDAVGVAMSSEERARVIDHTMEATAQELNCTRLAALSYVPVESQLRGGAVHGISDSQMRDWRWSVSDFPAAERVLRTGRIAVQTGIEGFPPELRVHFSGEIVLLPLMLGGRVLAVLIGQLRPDTDARSATWQNRATETAVRAALMVEMVRLGVALQDEQNLRQSYRVITASILEGHPLSEVAGLITETVSLLLREERVGLFLRTGEGRLQPVSLRNISAEYGESIARLTRPTLPFARSVATGLPYYNRNIQSDPQLSAELRGLFVREEITTLLLAVMQEGAAYTGALVVYPCQERQFTPAEIVLFQSFTDQAAVAVALTRQVEQQREVAMGEERNRLAREMHDTVAQSLTGLILQIETARTSVETGELAIAGDMLASARTQAKRALEDTRRAVQGLAPVLLERQSASQAIAEEARRFEAETGIPALFILTGDEHSLLPEQQTALLRITQEGLTNARKHAQAHRVRIGLQFGPENVSLIVEDDGIGFDVAALITPGPQGGYGLFGMRERARLLDGEVEIESPPGWGTRLRVVLPYRPASPLVLSRAGLGFRAEARAWASESQVDGSALPLEQIRVLLADDHDITRQGVRSLLEAGGEIVVIGEARDGAQAVAQARTLRPDVVLMDVQMPLMDGLEATRILHDEMPEIPVVFLTTFQTEESVKEAFSAGAKGYLLKDADANELIAAIRAARRGEALLAPAAAEHLASLSGQSSARSPASADALTERETEILQLLARGARNREIAAQLFLSIKTVEYHMAHLFAKLGVSNRTEAARIASERGLLSDLPNSAR